MTADTIIYAVQSTLTAGGAPQENQLEKDRRRCMVLGWPAISLSALHIHATKAASDTRNKQPVAQRKGSVNCTHLRSVFFLLLDKIPFAITKPLRPLLEAELAVEALVKPLLPLPRISGGSTSQMW